MKKFHERLVLIILVYGIASAVLTDCVYVNKESRYWEIEKDLLLLKLDHVSNFNHYKTLFVGSSLVHRHINPEVFDSAAGPVASPSYNLGQPGLFPVRSLKLVERLLDSPPDSLKFLFIELNRLDYLSKNFSSKQVLGSMGKDDYLMSIRSVFESALNVKMKFYYLFQYSRSFLFKYLGFGLIDYCVGDIGHDQKQVNQKILEMSTSGFMAKDRQLELGLKEEGLIQDRNKFLSDSTVVSGSSDNYRRVCASAKYSYSPTFLRRLNNIINRGQKKGIRIIFVTPPRSSKTTYSYILPIYNQLSTANRIDLADPDRFSEFYLLANSFDKAHMNSHGARIHSEKLAKEFVDSIINRKKQIDE